MADNKPLFAFYGDDFTGSTDALEWLCREGLKSVLFLEPPTSEQLKLHEGLQAFGVAGATRAMTPEAMQSALEPALRQIKETGVRYVHYKVCSTFDSSPLIGSIGKAIDVGVKIFGNRFTPIIQSAPVLGRYLFFGNLFARMGIGSNGEVFRLDRHPSMKHHPTTPADESDLRLHLGKQTKKQIGLVTIVDVIKSEDEIKKSIDRNVSAGAAIIFFDALENQHLEMIAAVLSDEAAHSQPLFLVGSSGVEIAFAAHFQQQLGLQEPVWQKLSKAELLLVVCGSCSPVTTKQIHHALQNGFKEVVIDVSKLVGEDAWQEMEEVFQKSLAILNNKVDLIIHSNGAERINTSENTAETLGRALGEIAKRLIGQTLLKRLVVAGGDTSSYAARALGIDAVEMIAPLAPGAPLCKAIASDKAVNGIEICFKGGQVGSEDFFLRAAAPIPTFPQ
ncbi:four-carbon acid sugar kinase family protein [Flavisolibacter ginsenosidimutans]|uniref:Four-carbon acid sugar kinase family protein n=1 Tax=Flavisolibacter ginsenosidimutans TaxID=661481 RepID=A0A5B8UGN4_9BACT|nr:four-carbon acid sugar kinase family protein [Flavisolibacter ginsenosidimutans]QEC55668.1 four-carbon acid sugar kinase family protein [Flavisolibacter ginsenosidimutans]